MDYEKDLDIDEDSLETEWLLQPQLMFKYSKHMAKTERDRDEAKEALNLCKAELDKKVRSNPEKYGIEKITEAQVTATILTMQDYKDANEEYLNASFEFTVALGAVKAIEQRKSALENLVRLHGQNYFSGPEVPHDSSYIKEQRQKKANQKVGSTLKRTR